MYNEKQKGEEDGKYQIVVLDISNANDIKTDKTDCREFWMIDRAPGFLTIICDNVNDIKTKPKKA